MMNINVGGYIEDKEVGGYVGGYILNQCINIVTIRLFAEQD